MFSGVGLLLLYFLKNKIKTFSHNFRKNREEFYNQERNVLFMAYLFDKYLHKETKFFIKCNHTLLDYDSCKRYICDPNYILDCSTKRGELCEDFLNKRNIYKYILFYQYIKIRNILYNAHPSRASKTSLEKINPSLIKGYKKHGYF